MCACFGRVGGRLNGRLFHSDLSWLGLIDAYTLPWTTHVCVAFPVLAPFMFMLVPLHEKGERLQGVLLQERGTRQGVRGLQPGAPARGRRVRPAGAAQPRQRRFQRGEGGHVCVRKRSCPAWNDRGSPHVCRLARRSTVPLEHGR